MRQSRQAIDTDIMQRIWAMPCAACGSRKRIEVDHVIPLFAGGTNDPANLQPLCRRCNSNKGNRLLTNEQILWRRRTYNGTAPDRGYL